MRAVALDKSWWDPSLPPPFHFPFVIIFNIFLVFTDHRNSGPEKHHRCRWCLIVRGIHVESASSLILLAMPRSKIIGLKLIPPGDLDLLITFPARLWPLPSAQQILNIMATSLRKPGTLGQQTDLRTGSGRATWSRRR